MKQLGQAMRPLDLQALAAIGVAGGGSRWVEPWLQEAMERHYELRMLPGVCEAIARRDWDRIDVIAARWDF